MKGFESYLKSVVLRNDIDCNDFLEVRKHFQCLLFPGLLDFSDNIFHFLLLTFMPGSMRGKYIPCILRKNVQFKDKHILYNLYYIIRIIFSQPPCIFLLLRRRHRHVVTV